jgi:hypothetical protein
MKRTSVFLDEDLERTAKRFAYKNGVSLATVVREALAAYIAVPREQGGLPSVAGSFSSGHSDTSVRTDELLWRKPHE